MSTIPVPRSREQIQADMMAVFLRRYGIPSLKIGGPVLSIFEAVATSVMRSDKDVFDAIQAEDLDSCRKDALDRKGRFAGVERIPRTFATGLVDISDSSFTKINSAVYQGRPAPVAGSTAVNIVDGSGFPATGSVYLGRGTRNYEGPIEYTSCVNAGTYWTLTLVTATLQFHNQGETVIVAQGGDRKVAARTVVQTARSSSSGPISFRTTYSVTLPDGEVRIQGVPVVCDVGGVAGNVPAGGISAFATAPFTGAGVTNTLGFNTGTDREDDDDYRNRIRQAPVDAIRGVGSAIVSAATGVTSQDDGRRVMSVNFLRSLTGPSRLVIDDGTGYEDQAEGIALEYLVENAIGGEQDVALRTTPVAKASVTSLGEAPFALADGMILEVEIAGTAYQHIFDATDYSNIAAATSYEVAAALNADPDFLITARTGGQGTSLVLSSRSEDLDSIEVTTPAVGVNANTVFQFPAGRVETVRLYRNDQPLQRDGRPAVLSSNDIGTWTPLVGNQTLILAVDGTPATTYTFTDAHFVAQNTGYTSVGKNSVAAWVKVLNAVVPGITATADGSAFQITSNKGASDGASLAITGGTLVSANVIDAGTDAALGSDYSLDRSTGDIHLVEPLAAGDRLSAGTPSPRAFLEGAALDPSITLVSDGHLWLAADGSSTMIGHNVASSTPVAVSVVGVHDWGYRLRVTATSAVSVFDQVNEGDWAVLWDGAFNSSLRGAWRVRSVDAAAPITYFDVERRAARSPRAGHAAVALTPAGAATSKVLVCGGWIGPTAALATPVAVTNTVEIFDPATNLWTAAAPMATARAYHTASVLPSGKVLVVGGMDASGAALTSVEIYNPTTNTWTAGVAYQVAVMHHRATVLASGDVLISGGLSGATYRTNSAVYAAATDTWGANVAMGTARARHGAVLLPSGAVLVASGKTTGGGTTTTCELYSAGVWGATGAVPTGRSDFGMASQGAPATKVVIVGDDRAGGNTGKYCVYTIAAGTWGADVAWAGTLANGVNQVVRMTGGNVLAVLGNLDPTTTLSATWNGAAWTTTSTALYAEATSRQEVCAVSLYNLAGTVANTVLTMGGLNPTRRMPSAAVEVYTLAGDAWSQPDPGVATGLLLTSVGLSFLRSDVRVQELEVPAGVAYTASALVDLLSPDGCTLETYRTTRLRLRANRQAALGAVSLVAADDEGAQLGIDPAVASNAIRYQGAVESQTDEGTPLFEGIRILEEGYPTGTDVNALVRVNTTGLGGGYALRLGRDHADGISTSPNSRWGRNVAHRATSVTVTPETSTTLAALRDVPAGGYAPHNRVWASSPYAFGKDDQLVTVIDGDLETQRFTIPFARRLRPLGAAYGTVNTFRDHDNADAPIGTLFGTDFAFDDFQVLMHARGKLYEADGTRSMLARYYLPGAIGERAKVRVAYPDAADDPVTCSVDGTTTINPLVRLKMAGGAAKTMPNFRDTTKVGVGCTATANDLGDLIFAFSFPITAAQRSLPSNVVNVTLTLPAGVAACGVPTSWAGTGMSVWLNSNDANFGTGPYYVAGLIGANIVQLYNPALGVGNAVGGAIGTLSCDPQGEVTTTGAGLVVGDYLHVSDNATSYPAAYRGSTFRINAIDPGYITCKSVEEAFAATQTTLTWHSVTQVADFGLFASSGDTANTFAAAVNALAAADHSTCPVTLTALGTGAGVLGPGTVEDLTSNTAWAALEDGVNWIGRTINPATPAVNYQFAFKEAVSANLAASSDWANETVYVLPATARNVVDWLNEPAVSGLSTVAEISLVDDARRVQIATRASGTSGAVQVQGGLANRATATVLGAALDVSTDTWISVTKDDAEGLPPDGWVEVRNTSAAARSGVLTAATILNAWTAGGHMTFSTPVYTQRFARTNVRMQFERQGAYIAISDPYGANTTSAMALTGLVEGDYIRIKTATAPTAFAQVSTQNRGIHQVVRVDLTGEIYGQGGTLWIKNDTGVEEVVEGDLEAYSYDSIMPGDELSIGHTGWGATNQGTWTVSLVGNNAGTTPQFVNANTIQVDVSSKAPTAIAAPVAALGASNVKLTQLLEGTPATLLKQIVAINPDPDDGSYAQIHLISNTLSRLISENNGSVLYAVDKLGFPTDVTPGVDGYRSSTSIVREVNRTIFGDPADPVGYPGVAAAGAWIVVEPPVVRRVKVSLLIRAEYGFVQADLADKVRAAVASVVNRTTVGQSLAISSIVKSVQAIRGVAAVTILSPTYDASNDQISVTVTEKLRVLDPDADVTVSFVSAG